MLDKAKELVAEEFTRLSGRKIKADDCYIVWLSKTLQNWKAFVGTSIIPRAYAEVIYNGNKKETYVDVYEKMSNNSFKD